MNATGFHYGRSFQGTRLEDACPCPKAPCGLVDGAGVDGCDQHDVLAGRTIRQGHRAEDCPRANHDRLAADDAASTQTGGGR